MNYIAQLRAADMRVCERSPRSYTPARPAALPGAMSLTLGADLLTRADRARQRAGLKPVVFCVCPRRQARPADSQRAGARHAGGGAHRAVRRSDLARRPSRRDLHDRGLSSIILEGSAPGVQRHRRRGASLLEIHVAADLVGWRGPYAAHDHHGLYDRYRQYAPQFPPHSDFRAAV